MSELLDDITMVLERMLDGDEPEKYIRQFATEIAALRAAPASPASGPTVALEEPSPSAAERLFIAVRGHLIPTLAEWSEQSDEWRARYAAAALAYAGAEPSGPVCPTCERGA